MVVVVVVVAEVAVVDVEVEISLEQIILGFIYLQYRHISTIKPKPYHGGGRSGGHLPHQS